MTDKGFFVAGAAMGLVLSLGQGAFAHPGSTSENVGGCVGVTPGETHIRLLRLEGLVLAEHRIGLAPTRNGKGRVRMETPHPLMLKLIRHSVASEHDLDLNCGVAWCDCDVVPCTCDEEWDD
jgi:hypothetical protein